MSLKWYSPTYEQKIRRGAVRGVTVGIGIVERRAVFLITNPPKTGRTYKRRGVSHQASAPGEAPASDTGALVGRRRITIDTQRVRARLTFSSKHARHLEHGTRKMEPRPFARRSLMDERRTVTAAIKGEITAELRR
jgi:hypothetical protein